MSGPSLPIQTQTDAWTRRILKALITTVVLTLVFEGLLRRLAGGGMAGRLIFFLKDILVLVMIPFLFTVRMTGNGEALFSAYRWIVLLFLPLVVVTAIHDPILAVFGAKQYLLFPMVGFAVIVVFRECSREIVVGYLRGLSFLILPTALVALYQLKLPADHWLNLSPEGTSLEDFAAGGRLRVSSTFPFVAQFCMFLNAAVYFCAVGIFGAGKASAVARLVRASLLPLLVLATFVTGSRGAVLGAASIIAVAALFTVIKGGRSQFWKFFLGALILAGVVAVLSARFPEFFEAYTARKAGTGFKSHDAEVANRVSGMFTNWFRASSPTEVWLGNGLGIMSNGSQTVSSYAARQRNLLGWGETDLANTYLEGGLYLVIIWWGFRAIVMLKLIRIFWTSPQDIVLPLAFILAYAFITAVFGTLGIQPPLAIWWWLAVGFACVLSSAQGESQESPLDDVGSEAPRFRGRSPYASSLHDRSRGDRDPK